MLTRVEALNFRCLQYIDQPLGSFHVLVGPNASGKTTFLDVVSFLSRLVSEGLDEAIQDRTNNFQDLVWQREGNSFELALEAAIPDERRLKLPNEYRKFEIIRYEVAVTLNSKSNEIEISDERVLLKAVDTSSSHFVSELLDESYIPDTILTPRKEQLDDNHLVVIHKRNLSIALSTEFNYDFESGFDWILSETFPQGVIDQDKTNSRQSFPFKTGARRSSLAIIPDDEFFFPVTSWFKKLLTEGVQSIVLNSLAIRQASPPGRGHNFRPDGSNLPWVISDLKKKYPKRFREWLSHVRTGLPEIKDIRIVQRADDRHLYLMVRYENGVDVPSWMVSDGTLRLLALTLIAYLPDFQGIYLIEEPENGLHPRAIETMFQSLSSVYDAQMLLATHSPAVISVVNPEQVLCFAKSPLGATQITRGDLLPALQQWHGETNLGTLFAAGVLGE